MKLSAVLAIAVAVVVASLATVEASPVLDRRTPEPLYPKGKLRGWGFCVHAIQVIIPWTNNNKYIYKIIQSFIE
ncbi:hypothetical protein BDF22DRAFT_743907 [Syncephalis plumigaleata]|nr:hypothetical protein BDF22DRAFT_743907 [Syncephalis plumigaleata]